MEGPFFGDFGYVEKQRMKYLYLNVSAPSLGALQNWCAKKSDQWRQIHEQLKRRLFYDGHVMWLAADVMYGYVAGRNGQGRMFVG